MLRSSSRMYFYDKGFNPDLKSSYRLNRHDGGDDMLFWMSYRRLTDLGCDHSYHLQGLAMSSEVPLLCNPC